MNLTEQDKALLETNFGEEIEKLAAERVGACQEAYAYGFSKLAAEAADAKDEEDKKEKEEKKEEKMDEESEKAAAELGAFIERGFFDGLRKLGSERHGDEMHYLAPFVEEKMAEKVAEEVKKDDHYFRRFLLGNSISAAIEAPKGEKLDRFGKAYGHAVVESMKGLGAGAAGGAVAGGGAGLGYALATRGAKGKGALMGALLGSGIGAAAGSIHGSFKGQLGERATQIHRGEK